MNITPEGKLERQAHKFAAKMADEDYGEEFDAWVAFYLEHGEGWEGVRYLGTYGGASFGGGYAHRSADVQFAMDEVDSLDEIPGYVVVDWEATATGLLMDVTVVELSAGDHKAYFR